ncbi:MAG: flippase-like domain-containing protein, partial [Nitrospira sp.]|nr:flippase-like domain-containing protein [Nitrospira sp.]
IFGLRLGKRMRTLSEFYDYFHSYWNNKVVIVKASLISIIIQILGISAVYILALGLGQHIPFLACLIFLPIIILFTMLPISISGLGIREGAFVFFFGIIGVKPEVATAISLSWFLSVTIGSLLGLIEYIRYKKGEKLSD